MPRVKDQQRHGSVREEYPGQPPGTSGNGTVSEILLLGATFDTANMGVRSLAVGAMQCLLGAYPTAQISVLDYGSKGTVQLVKLGDRDIVVSLVNMRFSIRLYLANNVALLLLVAVFLKVAPFGALRRVLIGRIGCLRRIRKADLVVSLAGGDSFSDIYGLERLLYVTLPQILVLLMGKKLVLLPQTIGPFSGGFARRIAAYILRRAHQVYVRDYHSLEVLDDVIDWKAPSAIGQVRYDVGFAVDAIQPSCADVVGLTWDGGPTHNLVGVNVSGLLMMGGYSRNNMFRLSVDYRTLINDILALLIVKKNARVLLVPHVFGTDRDSECDVPVCEQLYETLRGLYPDRLGLVRGTYDQSEIKFIIGQCDFFVGSRMHACIAAISQSVPAVCVAYSDKFTGVMETIGMDELVADARRMSREQTLSLIEGCYDRRWEIHSQLQQKMPNIRRSVLALFGDLTETQGQHRRSGDARTPSDSQSFR